jgi:adenylate cyclase
MKDDAGGAVQTARRRLAAIMFTDIVGFSRLMGADETRMLRVLAAHNQVIEQAVAEHHGRVIKTMGDAFIVDFPSVVHAVQCARHVQERFRNHNAQTTKEERLHVRIGIHLGDIIEQNGDVLGDGVNIASRLQTLTEPGTICISQAVYQEVEKKLPLGTVVSLGRPKLKNIAQRFQVYALLPEAPQGAQQRLQVQRLKLSHRVRPGHRLVAAGLLLIAGTLVTVRYFPVPSPNTQHALRTTQASLPLPDKPSIAVLPFVNMSNDPEQEYFSDGMTDDLIAGLSNLSGLLVISRHSAFTYKGKAVKVQDVSRDLGVRYVLEGSVRKSDGKVRITAQLIDATTGGHLWSGRYDRELKDIFALQEEIKRKIVVYLALKLTDVEGEQLEHLYTTSPEAYDYRLRGLEYLWRFTKETHTQARQMIEKAIELDPNYAVAHSLLGWTYLHEWVLQWSEDPQTLERAFSLVQKALALDDSHPQSHELLGFVHLLKNKRPEQAVVEMERAVALSPNWYSAYAALGLCLNYAGRPAEAIEAVEKAIRLNPRNPAYLASYLTVLGEASRLTGRDEEAISALKRALTLMPNLPGPHQILAVIYSEAGRAEEARAEAKEILKVSPNFSLEGLRQRLPYKDPGEVERVIAALRNAGLR